MISLKTLALVTTSLWLAGCSMAGSLGGLLNKGTPTAAATTINVPQGNDLAMPPSLQLPPPAAVTSDAYATQVAVAPAQQVDYLKEMGISRLRPDGKPKTAGELNTEYRAARLKRKRETNPNYGTIFNIGNIFSDN